MRIPRAVTLGMLLALACGSPHAQRALEVVPLGAAQTVSPRFQGSYAWLCGIGEYVHARDLPAVPGEMAKLARTLTALGYRVETCTTPDGQPATHSAALKASFDGFVDRYGHTAEHRLLMVFSGHGYTWEVDGVKRGYLVPADVPLPRTRQDPGGEFTAKALSMDRVLAAARDMTAHHALFVFDSCFSGSVFETRDLPAPAQHVDDALRHPVRQFLTAGSEDEEVPGNSEFMEALIEGLTAKAADTHPAGAPDGYVTGTELGLYVASEVRQTSPQFGKIRERALARGDYVFEVGMKTQVVPSVRLPLPDVEAEYWQACRAATTKSYCQAYLNRYPRGAYAELARARVEEFTSDSAAAGPPPAPPAAPPSHPSRPAPVPVSEDSPPIPNASVTSESRLRGRWQASVRCPGSKWTGKSGKDYTSPSFDETWTLVIDGPHDARLSRVRSFPYAQTSFRDCRYLMSADRGGEFTHVLVPAGDVAECRDESGGSTLFAVMRVALSDNGNSLHAHYFYPRCISDSGGSSNDLEFGRL